MQTVDCSSALTTVRVYKDFVIICIVTVGIQDIW